MLRTRIKVQFPNTYNQHNIWIPSVSSIKIIILIIIIKYFCMNCVYVLLPLYST